MFKQLSLFDKDSYQCSSVFHNYELTNFSFNGFCDQQARLELEKKYIDIVEETDIFNRKSVSYQANKTKTIHNWLKYKEGFSSELVELLLDEFNVKTGDTILDPFVGSGTVLLVSKMSGINGIGIDILPLSEIVFNAKNEIFDYNINELEDLLLKLNSIEIDETSNIPGFNHINITRCAFPEKIEKDIMFFTQWIQESKFSKETKNLFIMTLINILEKVSYTAKDGQYLRWDYRSAKVIQGNKIRIQKGKEPFKTILNKGELPDVKETLFNILNLIIQNIKNIHSNGIKKINSTQRFIRGSVLFELPKIQDDLINAVITSPPYCNRYDYTRIYALELAYLNVSEKNIRELRQDLLTCTVENKTKIKKLEEFYISIDRKNTFEKIMSIIKSNAALNEINQALEKRLENGDINNKGVLQMVDGYFTELAFTIYELYRTCKKGAMVAFVNDNVRYGGEIIPVDFLITNFAEKLGFKPVKVYVIKQMKGNSSQQMKKFGRVPLRKSITIWEK